MTRSERDPAPSPIQRRIAIVAVHGVGDQPPMASARAIGDLLQNLNIPQGANGRATAANGAAPCSDPPGPENPLYDPFLERTLRINVRPVVINKDEWAKPDGVRGPFHQWVSDQRQTVGGKRSQTVAQTEQYDADISSQFIRGQLRCYHGDAPEDTYETIRLEGLRHNGADRGPEIVHIYELYWADLSRLRSSLLNIVSELYQILLHLPSLGAHVVDAESLHHDHTSWTYFRATQSWAALCLTVVIPLINLFMLGNALAIGGYLGLAHLSGGYHAAVPTAVVAIILTVAMGWPRWKGQGTSLLVWVFPVVFLLASLLVIWLTVHECGGLVFANPAAACQLYARGGRALALLELFGLAAAAVVLVVVAYNRMRPGFTHWAGWLAVTMAPVTAASLVVTYFATGSFAKTYPGFDGTLVLFRLFECLYIALMIGWLALTLATIAAWLTGDWALRHVEPAIADDRPARGRWTARLTLSVATFAFATVTLIAWALINNGIAALVLPRMPYVPLLMFANGRTARDLTTFMANVTDYGGFSALLVLLAAGFVAALPALWGLGPVVWAEVRPPSFQASQGEYSRRLGRWLTLAFRGLRTSGRILYITTTWFVPLSVALIVLPALIDLPLGEYQFLLKPLRYLGAFGGAFVIGLFMMRGQLKNALLGFRTTLDVMLDVDNWLREHPLEANPKARICGRYVSLLRYICDWRDPLDRTKKYDAIVFVTHSQGTVITADLLRFLKREARGNMQAYDPPLAELERPDMQVTLFTMGCPLRDLYGLRFPRLYGWTRHSDQAAMAAPSPPPDLLRNPQRGPQPSDLVAVKQWVNAYRSGDYIGRFLWRNDACSYAWDPNAVSADGVEREEFCIGAGAHTHYWDHTAPTIARRLNQLLG